MDDISLDAFEALVSEVFEQLPHHITAGLDNVVFVVQDLPDDGAANVLGLYSGHNLTDRAEYGYGQLPDTIALFRQPLLSICHDEEQLRHQIHVTLVHEIGHYYGLDDAQLQELGWA